MKAPALPQQKSQTRNTQTHAQNQHGKKTRRKALRNILLAITIVTTTTCLYSQPLYVPSESMEPTIKTGTIIFSHPAPYGFSTANLPLGSAAPESRKYLARTTPHRGDIIIFRLNRFQGRKFIKRVIGIPGDHIQIKNNILSVNGHTTNLTDTGHTYPCDHQNRTPCIVQTESIPDILPPHAITYEKGAKSPEVDVVLRDRYFVMGDNRPHSLDSRWPDDQGAGLVPLSRIIGQYVAEKTND